MIDVTPSNASNMLPEEIGNSKHRTTTHFGWKGNNKEIIVKDTGIKF